MTYKIYTSYFGNLRKLNEAGIVPISIARWNPKWFHGFTMQELAPTKYMLSDACSTEEYIRLYKQILSGMYSGAILKSIESMGKGRDVALLCYEKPGDFCHRHMFAEWFTKTTGIQIDEFAVPVVKQIPQYTEGSLF